MLENINSPNDLKKLSIDELDGLCDEIRDFLITSISKTGGHLASNLGAVELIVALHYVFDSPLDKLVFDVGHQSYTHKILTGRREQFSTLRKKDGLAGFPKSTESEHDAFISGHSSTSISVALGIATAFKLDGKKNHAIAVIGDGSFTGGQAYEGLNNAGRSKAPLIVLLNHNDMSISKNVGGLANYLTKIRFTRSYLHFRTTFEKVVTRIPFIGKHIMKLVEHGKSAIKSVLYQSTFFEQLGFKFLGPLDGHDIKSLIGVLTTARELNCPVFIQAVTIKGKGYSFAEDNPGAFHGIAKFDVETGNPDISAEDSYSTIVGKYLEKAAFENERICAITAAMKYGTGLQYFSSSHKDRFFDVGIAEAHALTFATGLATQGYIPVFCVYSSFFQRSIDQLIHDASIEIKHIILAIDRAGIVGEDGETHQGIFDVALLNTVPNITVYSPCGYDEAVKCFDEAINANSVIAIRYPRGRGKQILPPNINYTYIDNHSTTLVVTYGRISNNCVQAVENNVSLLKLTKIVPIDIKVLHIAREYKRVIFIEEGIENGGIAEHFGALLSQNKFNGEYKIKAIQQFVKQATVNESLQELGFDVESIKAML